MTVEFIEECVSSDKNNLRLLDLNIKILTNNFLIIHCFPFFRLKTTLQKKLCSDSVDLSGIPLSTRDVRHVAYYLQTSGGAVVSVDLSFTELRDEGLRIVLPVLSSLPKLTTLALNGNRLTVSIMKDLTEAVKNPQSFLCLAWIDLGNNVDIFTMPQVTTKLLTNTCNNTANKHVLHQHNCVLALYKLYSMANEDVVLRVSL